MATPRIAVGCVKYGGTTDAEIEQMHGDSRQFPIAAWRKQFNDGETDLSYIDWRADQLWWAGQGRG